MFQRVERRAMADDKYHLSSIVANDVVEPGCHAPYDLLVALAAGNGVVIWAARSASISRTGRRVSGFVLVAQGRGIFLGWLGSQGRRRHSLWPADGFT